MSRRCDGGVRLDSVSNLTVDQVMKSTTHGGGLVETHRRVRNPPTSGDEGQRQRSTETGELCNNLGRSVQIASESYRVAARHISVSSDDVWSQSTRFRRKGPLVRL